MSGVDVIAVMHEAALSQWVSTDRGDMAAALAAVAELIDACDAEYEAVKAYTDATPGETGGHELLAKCQARRRAALAVVKGEQP